jgi:hypothetical protein
LQPPDTTSRGKQAPVLKYREEEEEEVVFNDTIGTQGACG